jgi:hypothetical protein
MLPPLSTADPNTVEHETLRSDRIRNNFSASPPVLVQRCNGTTVGLGYLKVGWVAYAKFPLGQ